LAGTEALGIHPSVPTSEVLYLDAIKSQSDQEIIMSVRFVKTLEEVRRLQKLYAQPEFEQFRGISAVFETDPDVIAAVLPPPLKPTDNPIASVSVSHIGLSNGLQPFGAAGLSVQCEYEGIVGDYPLTMPMSTDSAVIFGRELYGEPKKVADIQVRRNGDNIVGTVQRYGITYIELQGDVVEAGEPGDSGESSRFYFKYMPAPDGNGFDNDPVLVRVRHTGKTRLVERLDGEVLLRESAHDPVADIPMRKLLSMSYAEGDTYTHGEILTRIPGEPFLPFMFGKADDMELLATEGAPVRV